MITDTLKIFRHHDQVKDRFAILAFFFLNEADHFILHFIKVKVDLIVRFHHIAGKLKISVHISCDTVAHHFAYLRRHSADHLDIFRGCRPFL